tara:strand:- start:200 stop:349 length:150 start_codon:yes stop_codon:yes gene_type:complete
MKEVILNDIENKRDVETIFNIIEDQLLEQGIGDAIPFAFEIKVFYEDEG